jgi:hypothetical protein
MQEGILFGFGQELDRLPPLVPRPVDVHLQQTPSELSLVQAAQECHTVVARTIMKLRGSPTVSIDTTFTSDQSLVSVLNHCHV